MVNADPPVTERTARVAAARRLTRRVARERAGEFLVEGPQAVREAVRLGADRPGLIREIFGTDGAIDRHADIVRTARERGIRVSRATERAVAGLSETAHPQGLVALCAAVDVPLTGALSGTPRLVVVLAEVRDPGNAGTVLRCADAAGADAVVFAGDAVDPYNGKCVRSCAGSLFHLPVVRGVTAPDAVDAARRGGLQVLAADASGESDLDDLADAGGLAAPTAWLFGNEAHGLPDALSAAADRRVRVPIHGRAESLNLAAAAAVCLYASARAQRGTTARAQRRAIPATPPPATA